MFKLLISLLQYLGIKNIQLTKIRKSRKKINSDKSIWKLLQIKIFH